MNRQQRRRAAASARRDEGGDRSGVRDRATLLRFIAELAEGDSTLSGVTIVMPDGRVDYVDAALLRRGGGRA
jgi:hypothetical protein